MTCRRFLGVVETIDRQKIVRDLGGDASVEMDGYKVFFRGYILNYDDYVNVDTPQANDLSLFSKCVVRAYEKHGIYLNRHLFGEFSTAIYDPRNQEIFLFNDALGISPLYFSDSKSTEFFFGSHLEDIVRQLEDLELDDEFVADYISYGDHYQERTPYKKIKRLPPGSCGSRNNCSVIQLKKTFDVSDVQQLRYTDKRDYIDHFNSLLSNAITRSIPRVGKVWCELSGGLDSSTVASFAAPKIHLKLETFSFVYSRSKSADESEFIDEMNLHLSAKSHRLDVDTVKPFGVFPSEKFPQPFLAMINLGLLGAYGKLLDENKVDVVLTGNGGDAVFFGDGPEPFFLADVLRERKLVTFFQEVNRWAQSSKRKRPYRYWVSRCGVTPIVRHSKGFLIQDQLLETPWLSNDDEKIRIRNGKLRKNNGVNAKTVFLSWYLERIYLCSNVVSNWQHRSWMKADFRHPLMNIPLIKFMCSVPPELNVHPAFDRTLQRQALTDHLPTRVLNRKTKGSPDQALYRGFETSEKWLDELKQCSSLRELKLINYEKWLSALDSVRLGRCDNIKLFKAAASLEVWLGLLKNANSG